ncbi:MAG: efflux RND transporter permease subunit [Saprospiraceae bacterium]
MGRNLRKISIIAFTILSVIALFFATKVEAEFNFEQFFPDGDSDLEFFYEFIEDFETDDNFMLIGVTREEGVFEQSFLEKVHDLSINVKRLPYIQESNSVTKVKYPQKTPFGFAPIPAVHITQPEKYAKDKERLLSDERFSGNLLAKDGKSTVVFIKLKDKIEHEESRILMKQLDSLVQSYSFESYHYLGRPNFQVTLVDLQFWEIGYSTIVSGLLVTLIMWLIFRRRWGVFIAILSILVAMILFVGLLGLSGRPLNVMSALYPVILIIVGTSDVIHIMSKYIDELRKGKPKSEAIKITIKEIGLATLLTSITTAVGFLTLLSSKIPPIRDFGLNSALGVLLAYVTVLCFTTALLSFFKADKIIKLGERKSIWEPMMEWFYHFTKNHPKQIAMGTGVFMLLCFLGISMVTTNYNISNILPKRQKITNDYFFFEKNYTGFRPFEIAVLAQDTFKADDYKVLSEMAKLEEHLKQYEAISPASSITAAYKSVNMAFNGNRMSAYQFPDTEKKYKKYKRFLNKLPSSSLNVLISKDRKKARISSKVHDVGSDKIDVITIGIDDWISKNIDPNIVEFRRTGTSVLFDKNEVYVRDSILSGLGIAIAAVCLLMGFIFRQWKMVVISLIPNIFPLLIAGALLGFAGIELESGVAIVFAIVFGIAVDDTIHFLSKFKLTRAKGVSIDEALHVTFLETGKAICLTSVILFFGFLVMLFSINPPSVTVGILISVTLLSALFSDLLTIPILIRWFFKDDDK